LIDINQFEESTEGITDLKKKLIQHLKLVLKQKLTLPDPSIKAIPFVSLKNVEHQITEEQRKDLKNIAQGMKMNSVVLETVISQLLKVANTATESNQGIPAFIISSILSSEVTNSFKNQKELIEKLYSF